VRILVTGASGFIGGEACAALLARGHQLSALVRRPGSQPAGCEPLAGDLGDAARLAQVVDEAQPECVVHLAAEIASQRSAAKVEQVNVAGTRHLLDACLALGRERAPRIVFASTVVTGDAGGALLTEQEPLPVSTPYGRSKQEGERMIRDAELESVVIRPGHVYGPGGWYAQELLARLRQPGRFAVIGSGANMWDVVHVDDVVDALVLGVERAAPGSLYHVADDEPIRFYDFMALSARAIGVGAPRRIPATLARIVAGANAVDAVVRSARTSNVKIKAELGWSPRFAGARDGVPAVIERLTAAA